MSPAGYKSRYEKLQVPLDDGGTAEVRVNRYKLKGLSGHDVDEAGWKAFYNALNKHKVDMELRVDPGARSYRILHRDRDSSFQVTQQSVTGPEKVESSFFRKVAGMARYAFLGKGAPEHCQIVLQLAEHWGLAPGGLQAYADKALGLDCNGFVGNYLWHSVRQQDWSSMGVSKHQEGPDITIDGYFHQRKAIRRWEELNPARSYILGKVNGAGQIVPGGSLANAGHIAITEPGLMRPATGSKGPAVWVVESTAAHAPGLCATWYSLLKVDKAGVFTFLREDMIAGHKIIPFKMAPV